MNASRLLFPFFCFWLLASSSLIGQSGSLQFKVYGFEEGLSHRNVFKIQQDHQGFIWMATYKGLNRFDGHQFIHYLPGKTDLHIPAEFLTDLEVAPDSSLYLSSASGAFILDPSTAITRPIGRKNTTTKWLPGELYLDRNKQLWGIGYLKQTGNSILQKLDKDGQVQQLLSCEGTFSNRAFIEQDGRYFFAHRENNLTEIDAQGQIIDDYPLQSTFSEQRSAWVTHLQTDEDGRLWALLSNGQLYYLNKGDSRFKLHPITRYTYNTSNFTTFLVEENGDVWLGGLGALWLYRQDTKAAFNYDARVKKLTENNCTYRQVMKDASDVIWVASDFGAIRIVRSDKLFENYLSEGNENCSNGFCSMRGITGDEVGNIYFSYYNSIHVLNTQSNNLRPLFPQNDFFNFPFGLHHHKGILYTGNGRMIDLKTLKVDSLFSGGGSDKGVVMTANKDELWMGFEQNLYRYRPSTRQLKRYEDPNGLLDQVEDISYLHKGRSENTIWVGTTAQGVIQLDKDKGSQAQYLSEKTTHVLSNDRVIAIYETANGQLWVATANGFNVIALDEGTTQIYTTEEGLANDFINGLLSEGDSCAWLSTDNGLSRLSLTTGQSLNFYKEDGLSKNEFNRISFYQDANGRMFFGGLNGINAFYPGEHFLRRRQLAANKMLFTAFSKFDGQCDSIITQTIGLSEQRSIQLDYRDKFFSFEYALANYENPTDNLYSYQ
ncbi:MAG: two-component regulator propeller domain-containing protein, partial [Bacteroidota bacterium]